MPRPSRPGDEMREPRRAQSPSRFGALLRHTRSLARVKRTVLSRLWFAADGPCGGRRHRRPAGCACRLPQRVLRLAGRSNYQRVLLLHHPVEPDRDGDRRPARCTRRPQAHVVLGAPARWRLVHHRHVCRVPPRTGRSAGPRGTGPIRRFPAAHGVPGAVPDRMAVHTLAAGRHGELSGSRRCSRWAGWSSLSCGDLSWATTAPVPFLDVGEHGYPRVLLNSAAVALLFLGLAARTPICADRRLSSTPSLRRAA